MSSWQLMEARLNSKWFCFVLLISISTIAKAVGVSNPTSSDKEDVTSEAFDPDGYYFPSSKLPKEYSFEHLELDGLPLYQDPSATEAKANIDGQDCRVLNLEPDDIKIECLNLSFGDVLLTGKFHDNRGKFWERERITPMSTVVMICDLVVSKAGKPVYKLKDLKFSYFEGD